MSNISHFLNTVGELMLSEKLYRIRHLSGLILCVIGISLTVMANPSNLDPTFGNLGRVVSSPDDSELIFGNKMALQTDGKIIMIGNGNNLDFIVARYNSDGSLDTTFGNSGWTSTSFEADSSNAVAVDIQPDGKIVVGGVTQTVVKNRPFYDFGIARFNSDGSLDTTFDNDGKAIVSFNPEVFAGPVGEHLTSLKVANDGKIVLGGYGLDPAVSSRFILARLNPNGSLDTTFGTNGRVVGESSYIFLNDLTILSDGSIVAVGSGPLVGTRLAIKYNVNGSILWTYERNDGEFIRGGLYGITTQPDGKFVVVGVRLNRIVALRLNADGTEDSTFTNTTQMPTGTAISVAIQSDGKVVANFYPSNGWGDTRNSFNLIRYNSDGSLDSGFGNGGIVNTTVTNGLDYGNKVLIQPNGKILVGGYSRLDSPTRYYFSMVRYLGDFVIPQNTAFDYDGDGKADVSVYRPSDGVWYLNQSTNGFSATQFGISTDRIVPADYDGDGRTDLAIYRDGVWWILNSGDNSVKVIQFGIAEDKPQSGDFDGDGKDDLVVFRPSTGVWYVLRSSNNSYYAVSFGLSEDIPQAADYDGDDITDLTVFRPSSGVWYVQKSTGGVSSTQFGLSGDRPTANDFDGDGKTDIAVWRPTNGDWYVIKSSSNQVDRTNFGVTGDIPVAADYDGDGKADISVFRPANGIWYQLLSTNGWSEQIFGLSNDKPTPGAYNP